MASRFVAADKTRIDRGIVVVLTLYAAAVRLWRLGDLGLSYDEAATALMARAPVREIVIFHWTAGFEHPPLWQLLAHAWSQMAGQSEYALRFVPALAGILAIPLIWQFARLLFPENSAVWHSSAALAALAPILVYYSQEARMYTIVLVLALGSMIATAGLVRRPTWSIVLWLALINAVLTGFHYYAALLLAAEGIFFVVASIVWPDLRRNWQKWIAALALSGLPLLLWMAFSPGFHMTLGSVFEAAAVETTSVPVFLDELWRDLSFAAIRWQPIWSWIGYLLLPLLVLGLFDALWLRRGAAWSRLSGWYLLILLAVPVFFSALLFGGLSTRYVLFITPALFVLVALGLVRAWSTSRLLGGAGALLMLGLFLAALFYYRADYVKSNYREMSASLAARIGPDDAVLLESPRQHLSAKYYLDVENPIYPIPDVDLPAYWPITAPPVVPEAVDGDIQAYLRQHPRLWLSLTAQDEVDLGEFVPKYLAAVAYRLDCDMWQDVDLCQYASPRYVDPVLTTELDVDYGGGLALQGAKISTLEEAQGGPRHLLVELDWLAATKPEADHKVSLRLTDGDGLAVVQSDGFPIGPLLPPTTWGAADRKPGYMALTLPSDAAGDHFLAITLYDPTTLETIASTVGDAPASVEPLVLANIRIGDTIEIEQPADEP